MDALAQKPKLYRWKRQYDTRVYSRSQRLTTKNEIQDWIRKVEHASNQAAEEAIGSPQIVSGKERGRSIALKTRHQLHEHDETLREAQDLLNQWMDEKVQLENELEFGDEAWHQKALEVDVKREWDHLLENNFDTWDSSLNAVKAKDPYSSIYEMDEKDAVNMVLSSMMEKEVIKDSAIKDLGKESKLKSDPRTKMELRHKQVRENREKRQAEIEKRRRDLQAKKDAQFEAKQILLKEEKDKAKKMKHEEMEIQKEMAKIRKEMQEEKRRAEESKARKRREQEMAMKLVENERDTQKIEMDNDIEEKIKNEKKREEFLKKMEQLQARQAAVNFKVLQRHFSAWYTVILECHMKLGKAKAIADWKCLVKAWNGWKSLVRERKLQAETQRYQTDVRETYRKFHKAEDHHRKRLLLKYFQAWQFWIQEQHDRRELEEAQSQTKNKMMAFLEAAATGKLWQNGESVGERRGRDGPTRPNSAMRKVDELFESSNKRRLPVTSGQSSVRSSVVNIEIEDRGKQKPLNPRVPREAWQVTRRHVNLSPDEIRAMGFEGGDIEVEPGTQSQKRLGKTPWHVPQMPVNAFEHRHKAQQKILEQQQKQLREQQRLIEELQFNQQNQMLQQQLLQQQEILQKQLNSIANSKPDKEQQSAKKISINSKEKKTGSTLNAGAEHVVTSSVPTISSARSNHSETISATSNTSSGKYVNMLKKMEERAASRAKIKEERERKRQRAEEEKLRKLQEEEQEILKRQEEEKRLRVQAHKEKKRMEKQREEERQQQVERFRQLTVMADQHYQKSVLKYRGLLPMKRLVEMAHTKTQDAHQHFTMSLLRKTFMSWHLHVRDLTKSKKDMADEMHKYLVVRQCFRNWKNYKNIMSLLEQKAQRYFSKSLQYKVFTAWADYTMEEKVAGWEKERHAREHSDWRIKKKMFHIWHQYPDLKKKEEEREKRKADMRRKVASLLADFNTTPSQSVDQP